MAKPIKYFSFNINEPYTGKSSSGNTGSFGGGGDTYGGGSRNNGNDYNKLVQAYKNRVGNQAAQELYNKIYSSANYIEAPTENYASGGGGEGSFGGGGGTYGGGSSGPQRVDLTDILASYEQGAAAQRKTIQDTSESQRQALLTSLKRFQDETAEARAQQRRSYNASRADLEGQAFMANRQAAQNAASRGLGGSGLQQLAQLQNLINQSAATDKLAQSNTDVLKQLAAAAQSKEEDTNTAIQNLATETANRLNTIDANTAQARADLQYKENVRYEEARQAAEALAAQLAASDRAAARQFELYKLQQEDQANAATDLANKTLANITAQGMNALKDAKANKKSSSDLEKILNDYETQLAAAAQGQNVDYNTYAQQLRALYDPQAKKPNTWWDDIRRASNFYGSLLGSGYKK